MLTTTLAWLLTCSSAIEFDPNDPIASHPEMQALVNGIESRRRGLSLPNILSQKDKNDILALHNKIRAATARGEYTAYRGKLPKAANMKKMQWSDTLAEIATEWSTTCNWGHRGTPSSTSCGNALAARGSSWTSCGENLYGSGAPPQSWSDSAYGPGLAIKSGIEDGWSIDEAANYDITLINKPYAGCTNQWGACMVGHYTQVVWAESEYLGCGFSECNNGDWMKNYFTCNYYPPGNYYRVPYTEGSYAGSGCPDGYSVSTSDSYQDQDGEIYDLSGLCMQGGSSNPDTGDDTPASDPETDDPTSAPTPEPTSAPVDSPAEDPAEDPATDDSGDCPCCTLSGAHDSTLDGVYTATDTTCETYQNENGIFLDKGYTSSNNDFWGFYTTGSSPQWNTYGYCYTDIDSGVLSCSSFTQGNCNDPDNGVYCPVYGADISESTCGSTSDDDTTVSNDDDDTTVTDGECIEISGWGTTGWGTFGDGGQWQLYSAQPEYNGYPVYKWTGGDWYAYAMQYYKWYTISPTIGSMSGLKGWCGQNTGTNIPITQCDGVWSGGTGTSFYECGGQPLILDACLDDAAELVRFLLDGEDEDDYMQFALHEDVGCWGDSDEPVWMHTSESANATYYLHRDADLGAWQITQHLVEGDSVYECFEDEIKDCTAGTWIEFYAPEETEVGQSRAVRTLDTATVEVSASAAEEKEGLTAIDDLAIVLVVLLVVGVVGVVTLLWCRRRNRAKGAVTFEADDQEMGNVAATTTVGDTVDVGTDEE